MNATPADPEDNELLERFRAGDESAFDLLFLRHRDGLTRYAARLLGDPEEARDVCVDAFLRVVDGRFAHGRSLRALLYTTTHRLCIDRLRRRTRWVRVRRLFGAAPRTSITPEERVTDGEDRDRLADAIERLPTKHKAAIGLVYDEGLTTEDAAAILDITPTQLRSRLAYARRLIRDHVQQEEAP